MALLRCCRIHKRHALILYVLFVTLVVIISIVVIKLRLVVIFLYLRYPILPILVLAPILFCCISAVKLKTGPGRRHSDDSVLVSSETRLNIFDLNDHPATAHVNSCINLRPWRSYTHTELTAATNNFDQSNFLGGGGQANVFRGVEALDEGEGNQLLPHRNIAVKRFYFMSKNTDEQLNHANLQFKREVQALSRASHRNVVEFYGYCIHGRERLLVYELMPNGSLHDALFPSAGDGCTAILDWGQRLTIAKDAARGLDYLQNHCNINLVHLDIKPQNILLDEMLHAKIADFGLCKLIGRDQTCLTGGTMECGTHGYLPPELNFLHQGWENSITKKADVYSFGIVLLQLASGRTVSSSPTVDSAAPTLLMPGQTFRDAAYHLVKTQQCHLLLDVSLDKSACNSKVGVGMLEIGAMCVEINPVDRPDMRQVNKLLDGIESI